MIINRKNLKYLFKINPKHKIRDTLQLLIYLTIILSVIGLFIYHNVIGCTSSKADSHRNYLKIAVYQLTLGLQHEKELEGITIKDFSSSEEFAQMLANRLNAMGVCNFEAGDIPQAEEVTAKKICAETDKYFFQTANGTIYTIMKFENSCQNINDEDIENSDCVIQINSAPWENKKITGENIINVAIGYDNDEYRLKSDKAL